MISFLLTYTLIEKFLLSIKPNILQKFIVLDFRKLQNLAKMKIKKQIFCKGFDTITLKISPIQKKGEFIANVITSLCLL